MRIRHARKLMDEVYSAKKPKDDAERGRMDFKRRNLAGLTQEIGALVVLHYAPIAQRKLDK